ncbi:MAG: hypothetical protein HQL57_08490 [Magnetococcales bacterium]|nr:hypothetical protein [Magnetococcales bacterium]
MGNRFKIDGIEETMGRAYDDYQARSALEDQRQALKDQAISRRADWYRAGGGGSPMQPMLSTMSAAYDHVYEVNPPGAPPLYEPHEWDAVNDLNRRIAEFGTPEYSRGFERDRSEWDGGFRPGRRGDGVGLFFGYGAAARRSSGRSAPGRGGGCAGKPHPG